MAKRSHEATVITSEGQVVQKAFSIRNNCMGYNLMMEKLRKLTNVKSQIVFAVESTAHYWLALYTRLRKDGYKAIVLNPIQTSAMREMSIRKTKTDSKDSFLIAELKKYPTPKKLAHANLSKLTEILLDSSNGRFGEWKAQELKSLARDSFGVEDCEDIYSMLLLTMLDEIQSLTEKADELEKRISSLLKEFDSTITSVPGIGPILGACILSEIGDVTRFRSADKLAAYIGVDPSVNQSGEYISGHAHMSKRGSPYLRRSVWMDSIVAVQRDPMFRAYYDKKAALYSFGEYPISALKHFVK